MSSDADGGDRHTERPCIRDTVQQLLDAGLKPIRLRPGTKRPLADKWPDSSPRPEDFQADDNVGVILGPPSGNLVDLDLDTPLARRLAALPAFFGELPAFGRPSAGDYLGHRLVRCADLLESQAKVHKFAATTPKEREALASAHVRGLGGSTCLLEARAGHHSQTMFPYSVIQTPDGRGREVVCWAGGAVPEIPVWPWEQVLGRARLLAVVTLLGSHYPDQGARDDFCFHLAGVLAHSGLVPEAADGEAIIAELACVMSDEEAESRRGKYTRALERLEADEAVTGIRICLEETGLQVFEKKVLEWLGREERRGRQAPGFELNQSGRQAPGFELNQSGRQAHGFELNQSGGPIPKSQHNIREAMERLAARVSHDEFAGRSLIDGLDRFRELTDAALVRLRLTIAREFCFEAPKEWFGDVVVDTALANSFHPVRDYLDRLEWDGKPRADRWLADYMGADDTDYTRAVGRLLLVAAVKRVRKPGCKFDEWGCLSFVDTSTLWREGVHDAEVTSPVPAGAPA